LLKKVEFNFYLKLINHPLITAEEKVMLVYLKLQLLCQTKSLNTSILTVKKENLKQLLVINRKAL